MGKKADIDQRIFENLLSIMATRNEICGVFNVAPNTLKAWCNETYGTTFEDVAKRFREKGHASLRRTMFKLAETSVPMAIFLAKNYLGMSDVPTQQEAGSENNTAFIKAIDKAAKRLSNADPKENALIPDLSADAVSKEIKGEK